MTVEFLKDNSGVYTLFSWCYGLKDLPEHLKVTENMTLTMALSEKININEYVKTAFSKEIFTRFFWHCVTDKIIHILCDR